MSHSVKYDLLAVCNHQGSPDSGHYTAFYCLDGVWWFASDEVVRKAKSNEFEEITPTTAYYLFYVQKENTTSEMESTVNVSTTTSTTTNTTQHHRQHYDLPLTEDLKQLINAGKAPLPIVEDNTEFNKEKIYEWLCGNEACKSAVELWWSGLTSSQLLTASDFKQWVPQIAACSKCSNAKNLPKLLQSVSHKTLTKLFI